MAHPPETERVTTGTGYRLVLPDEWFTIDLDPGRRERSVRALAERQFAGIDNAPLLKSQAREELLAKAEAAYAKGGLDMFLSMQQIAGIPIAASLIVFLVPAHEGGHVADAERLAETLRDASVTQLPAGKAVRVLRHAASGGSELAAGAANLEVFVPVPGGGAWLLLSFSAPLGPLVPAMIKLFDAICMTLRWDR